jgi:hypothetical protein
LLLLGFAGAERGSRMRQFGLHPFRERVCATEHTPRDRSYLLERRHGRTKIVERGVGVLRCVRGALNWPQTGAL